MKKLLLLSFIALIPCARIVGANNGTAPQLAGPKSDIINAPMNDNADATCPTQEEFLAGMEAYMQYFDSLSPEDQQKEIAQANQAMEEMVSQLPPEQQEQLAQTIELVALEEVGQEILNLPPEQQEQLIEEAKNQVLSTPEGQIGFVFGAAEAENKIGQAIEADMAKNQPYGPALK